jgi:hypothetical protein
LLFAFSALEKWHDRVMFRAQLEAYKLVPPGLIPVTAASLIVLELLAATLLLSPQFRYGAALCVVLLMGYTAGIWVNLLRGRTHIDCGCLGSAGEGISYWLIARNLFLMVLPVVCFATVGVRPMAWLDYVSLMFLIISASLLYFTANQLIKNHLDAKLWWG